MVLYINTKNRNSVEVSLKKEGQVLQTLSAENEYGSQVLLPLISRLLEAERWKLEALSGIEVETGAGSFTGLRVGVAVANALGFSLKIPVNGKKIEDKLVY